MQPPPSRLLVGMPLAADSSAIAIQFVNESHVTGDLGNFSVEYNGSPFVMRDIGTFSPGISQSHQCRTGFVGGAVWRRPRRR